MLIKSRIGCDGNEALTVSHIYRVNCFGCAGIKSDSFRIIFFPPSTESLKLHRAPIFCAHRHPSHPALRSSIRRHGSISTVNNENASLSPRVYFPHPILPFQYDNNLNATTVTGNTDQFMRNDLSSDKARKRRGSIVNCSKLDAAFYRTENSLNKQSNS